MSLLGLWSLSLGVFPIGPDFPGIFKFSQPFKSTLQRVFLSGNSVRRLPKLALRGCHWSMTHVTFSIGSGPTFFLHMLCESNSYFSAKYFRDLLSINLYIDGQIIGINIILAKLTKNNVPRTKWNHIASSVKKDGAQGHHVETSDKMYTNSHIV